MGAFLECQQRLDDIDEYIRKVYPQKACQDSDYSRKNCLFNAGKATNALKYMQELREDTIKISETEYNLFNKKDTK